MRREAYALKQLTQEATWRGQIIHRIMATTVAETLLRHRTTIHAPTLTALAVEMGRRQLAFSAAGRYRTSAKAESGDSYAALFGHEYGYGLSDDPITELEVTAMRCFDHLASWEKLLRHLAAADVIRVEERVTTRIAGFTVTATPDLVAVSRHGSYTIVDWKVASSLTSDSSLQLTVYGLACLRSDLVGAPTLDRMRLAEANLQTGVITKVDIDEASVAETEDTIFRSASIREAVLGASGEDLDVRLSELDTARSPGTCATCGFRRLCLDSLAQPRRRQPEVIQGVLI